MNAIAPRLFGDLGEWLENEFPFVRSGMFGFRIEDYLSDGEYVVRAELPGLEPERDVSVTVDHGVLQIHAERREETKERHRSEFRYGSMHRTVRLPDGADETKIKATYDKGILQVSVPVHEVTQGARRVPIERPRTIEGGGSAG